MSHIDFTRVLG